MSVQDSSQPAMKAVFPALDGFGLSLAPAGITAKRVLDVALAGIAILLCLPLFALITLAIALDSRGPVLFRQRRAGEGGKLFGIYKFRSMHVLEDGTDIVQAIKGDARITRVGRFLRASSLDELPQLFNVLSGEMSLVGPRPHAIAHDEYYSARIANYARAPAGQAGHHRLGPGAWRARRHHRARRHAAAHRAGCLVCRASEPLARPSSFSPAPRWKCFAAGMRSDGSALLHPAAFEIHQAPLAAANDSYGEVHGRRHQDRLRHARRPGADACWPIAWRRAQNRGQSQAGFRQQRPRHRPGGARRKFPRHSSHQADIIHADGQAAVFASRFCTSTPIPERSATTDFIHDAAALAAAAGPALFPARRHRGSQCQGRARFSKPRYPGLQIVGRRHGYFSLVEEDEICDEINLTKPDVIWVGLSVPLEYEFAVRNKARLKAGWLVTCGGCFNFVTGAYKRAPAWMQQSGLEWLYRLAREPKRLFWRYAVTNPLAIFLLLTRTNSLPAEDHAPVMAQVRAAA